LNAYEFGVAAGDPPVWAAGIAGVLLAAPAATAISAWRAERVDPATMLREE
jgi:ABC-type lipoprotein release transport system permease subunit